MIVNILRIDYDCLIIYKVNVFFCKMFFILPKYYLVEVCLQLVLHNKKSPDTWIVLIPKVEANIL